MCGRYPTLQASIALATTIQNVNTRLGLEEMHVGRHRRWMALPFGKL